MSNKNYCTVSGNYIILHKKLNMNLKNQKNGNDQLNSIRNEFNNRLEKKLFLGNSNRVYWANSRRFRTIWKFIIYLLGGQQFSSSHWQYFKLYICNDASDIPAKYVISSGMCIISNSSFKIKAESKAHDAHKRDLTRLFDEFFTVLLTAKNEITIKT